MRTTTLTIVLALQFFGVQAQHISEWHTFRGGGGGSSVETIKRYGKNTALWFGANSDSVMLDSTAFLYLTATPPPSNIWQSQQAYFVLLDSLQKLLIKLQFSAGKSIRPISIEKTAHDDFLLTYTITDDTIYLNNAVFITDTTLKKGALCLTKVRANGEIAFTRYFPCGSALSAHIATLSDGRIVLAGDVNQADITFDEYVLKCLGCHVEDTDIFIALLDSNGQTLNARRFGGGRYDYCWDLMTSLQNDIYLSGSFESNFDCDSLHLDNYLSWYTIDAFLLKMSTNLKALWIKHAGSVSTEYGRSLSQDAEGNIYWGCEFDGETVIFGEDTLSGGNVSAFLCKMNETGNVIWNKVFTSDDGFILRIPEINISSDGTVWIALGYKGSVFFENAILPGFGKNDFALLHLDSEGNVLENYRVGSAGNEYCNGFQMLNDHQLFVSGNANFDDDDSLQFLNMILHDWSGFTDPDFYFILDLPVLSTETPPHEKIGVILMPNPVRKGALIQVFTNREMKDGSISFYNNLGCLVWSSNITGGIKQYSSPAPNRAGIYYLSIQSSDQYVTKRIIVTE